MNLRTILVLKVIPFGLLASISLLATGCSFGGSSTPAPTHVTRISIWRYGQDSDAFRQDIHDFVHSNSKVNVTYTRKDLANYEQSALKSLAGRLGPDIWSIPNDWLGDEQDIIVPLPSNYFAASGSKTAPNPVDVIHQNYPADISEQLITSDGKVSGLPTNVDSLQLFYNPDLMQASADDYRKSLGKNYSDTVFTPVHQLLSKPATTWGDILQQVKYINVRNGSTLSRSAIALGTADNIPNSNDILQLLMLQNGAKIVSTDHKTPQFHIPITTPSGGVVIPGANALDFYTSFSNPAKDNYSWNPSMPPALDAFAQNKVAMVIAYSTFGNDLKVKYPKFRYQTAPVPQVSITQDPVNFISYSIETVTQTADSQSAAFAFLKTYTDSGQANTLAREQHLRSPYLKYLTANSDDPITKQILTGHSVYKKNRQQFDQFFRQMIIDVSQNQIRIQDAIDGAADHIQGLLNPPLPSPTPTP